MASARRSKRSAGRGRHAAGASALQKRFTELSLGASIQGAEVSQARAYVGTRKQQLDRELTQTMNTLGSIQVHGQPYDETKWSNGRLVLTPSSTR